MSVVASAWCQLLSLKKMGPCLHSSSWLTKKRRVLFLVCLFSFGKESRLSLGIRLICCPYHKQLDWGLKSVPKATWEDPEEGDFIQAKTSEVYHPPNVLVENTQNSHRFFRCQVVRVSSNSSQVLVLPSPPCNRETRNDISPNGWRSLICLLQLSARRMDCLLTAPCLALWWPEPLPPSAPPHPWDALSS